MSGHSKWATIKRKKAATDSKRGKLFAKLIRAVEVAARQGGGDVNSNATLAAAVAKARASAVPLDNIERAIQRATGEADTANYDEVWYEGYAGGRCRSDGSGADRQPQPGCIRNPGNLHPQSRQHGRARIGGIPLREEGIHRG